MRLARKITLLFSVPFVLLLLVMGYRATNREIGIYQSQVASDLKATSLVIRPIFAEVWRLEGEIKALELLGRIDVSLPEIKLRWNPHGPDIQQPSAAKPPRTDPVVRFETSTNGERHVSVRLPLAEGEGEGPHGTLELSRSLDRETSLVRETVHHKLITTLGAVLGALVLSAVIGVFFIGRPIRQLSTQARRAGAGDLSHRVELRRRDELGELADEMNSMCSKLSLARNQLVTEADARVAALDQLRHADRLSTVGKLAAGLAHELGTPLNVVSGRAKMITSGKLAPDAIVENATIIGGQTLRMTTIIRGLLDFSRRGTGKKGRTDLSEIANTALKLLAPLSKKRAVALKVEGAEMPRILEADAGQIEQVLTNLVVNAVDATPDGGSVLVRLAEEEASPPAGHEGKPGLYLRLDVRDEGTGIRKEDLVHIFEPFFTTKDVGEGTGLGLSVAHGIVHDHGGWIAVESEPSRGSCFSVYIPRTT